MDVSPIEAEQALAAVNTVMQKTRHSMASSGAYTFLILTGAVWLLGFVATQFLPGPIVAYIWTALSLLACVVSIPWIEVPSTSKMASPGFRGLFSAGPPGISRTTCK